jgi:hypothetical protein
MAVSQAHLVNLLQDMHRRISVLEQHASAAPAPAPAPVPAPAPAPSNIVADAEKRIGERVSARIDSLETKLTHKYDQMVAKLVREQIADVQAELETLVEKYSEKYSFVESLTVLPDIELHSPAAPSGSKKQAKKQNAGKSNADAQA